MPLCQRAFVVLYACYLMTHSWAIAQENEQSEKALLETQSSLQQVEEARQMSTGRPEDATRSRSNRRYKRCCQHHRDAEQYHRQASSHDAR